MTGTIRPQRVASKQYPRAVNARLTLVVVLATARLACPVQAQTFKLLHSFKGKPDGAYPQASLITDSAGNLYGTTEGGGAGHGTVFKRDTAGHQISLYRFKGGSHGAYPLRGALVLDSGTLYGTTYAGGHFGYGTVFKLDTTGHETVLYSFTGTAGDGAYPYAGVVRDSTGNLYGTTAFGGGASYSGVVFKLDTAGTETVLHTFAGSPDGAYPYGGVILDASGTLYGTSYGGGTAGYGTVFKVSASGQETVVYSFGGKPDAADPYAGLTLDGAGNVYGTTYDGGASDNGTVFKLDASGQESVLYSFAGSGGDGAHPYAGVIVDASGNVYGTTYSGGDSSCGTQGCGTVFKLDTAGRETVLHIFEGHRGKFIDGSWPFGGLVLGTAGNLYGTTNKGGSRPLAQRVGTVFELTP